MENAFMYPIGTLVYFVTDTSFRKYQVIEQVTTKTAHGYKYTYTVEHINDTQLDRFENVVETQLQRA